MSKISNWVKTFEDFMQEQCPDGGRGGADGAQEAYERWVENLDAQEVWELAEKWGEYQFFSGKEFVIEMLRPQIEALNKK
jgi:hypothetical protein